MGSVYRSGVPACGMRMYLGQYLVVAGWRGNLGLLKCWLNLKCWINLEISLRS
jgi:hypothetical protein